MAPPEPGTPFNSAEPTLWEVEVAEKKARSSSAPGRSGVPYKVYKQCFSDVLEDPEGGLAESASHGAMEVC